MNTRRSRRSEALAGVTTEVSEPMLGWYASLAGQALQPHQESVIGAVLDALARGV